MFAYRKKTVVYVMFMCEKRVLLIVKNKSVFYLEGTKYCFTTDAFYLILS